MRGAKSSSTLCIVLHERGGGHDVARESSDAAGRGAEVLLPPAAPTGAMHLIRISASILSRSNLHAVRFGGASGSRPISPGFTQASRRARWRHGKASACVSQPLMRGSRISHSWPY
eukprot:604832-Pleurochrysis_carterae.AAC.4